MAKGHLEEGRERLAESSQIKPMRIRLFHRTIPSGLFEAREPFRQEVVCTSVKLRISSIPTV